MTIFLSNRLAATFGILFLLFSLSSCVALAQGGLAAMLPQDAAVASTSNAMKVSSSTSNASLPDAPAPQPVDQKASSQYSMPGPEASITTKYIPAGYHAQNLSAHQKMVVGFRDLYTPTSLVGYVISAGYSHVTNSQPNYGTNSGAFGQRVGASFARNISEGVFSDILLAPVLHEDPRYYVRGPSHSFVNRAVYSVTRPLITRNDQGHSTVNASQLLGYAGAAALSVAYSPEINRNAKDVASSYAGSIGGEALGFFIREFSTDFLESVHLRHKDKH